MVDLSRGGGMKDEAVLFPLLGCFLMEFLTFIREILVQISAQTIVDKINWN
jgi:hypothetical protein